MNVSEIRVKLVKNSKERLKAVCSVTFDGEFVIRDLKVIEGTSGLFVAMPSRKLADHCPKCRAKNHLRARFCNECGQTLDERRADRIRGGRARLHADIAHPINSQCRNRIQQEVVQAYHAEIDRSKQPGYRPVDYDDLDAVSDSGLEAESHGEPVSATDERRDGDSGSDYADLIAELKQDARRRRGPDAPRREERRAPIGVAADEAGDSPDAAASRPENSDTPDGRAREPESPASTIPDDDFGAGIL